MRITVVTLFPELFDSPLATSLLGKARAAGLLAIDFVNPRDFTTDRHRTVDDAPYGGGHGMVMKPGPLVAAIESVGAVVASSDVVGAVVASSDVGDAVVGGGVGGGDGDAGVGQGAPVRPHRVLLGPVGEPLDQARIRALAALPHLVLVCGRYEGIDQRVSDLVIDQEISLGDFVLSGGEIAALAVIDAVSRLVPGVLGELALTEEESFSDGVTLEYPQYTRPPEFRGAAVPDVLLGGNHERVRAWRRREALRRTARRRPDLLARRRLSDADLALAAGDPGILPASRTYAVLVHHPVVDRTGAEVTSSVTNLDIHDIARSAATYGLAGYLPVTPIAAQREKVEHILEVWRAEMSSLRPSETGGHRGNALAAVAVRGSIEEALDEVATRHGARPLVVATSARRHPDLPTVGFDDLARRLPALAEGRPVVLLFGTGHGLASRAIALADWMLAPIEGNSPFNHLSVRSAVAVVLDRLFGAGA